MKEKNLNEHVSKGLSFEIKSVDTEKRTIVAYGSAFGVKDSHGDIILKGAFAGNIGKSILFLNAHNSSDSTNVLGVIKTLEEDEFGLKFEVEIADTTKGNDILQLYKIGVPYQHSIGGYYGKGPDAVTYDDSQGAWLVKSFDLREISVVPFGSNSQTNVVAIKTEQEQNELQDIQKRLKALEESVNKSIVTPIFNITKLKNLLNNE